jgi:hypothetical protein
MRVGFTGTRDGMTDAQRGAFTERISCIPAFTEFHHGACVGADEEAAEMLWEMWHNTDMDARTWVVVAHPANMRRCVSVAALRVSEKTLGEKPPLDRNRDIVDSTDVLFACPKGPEELRSGTWSTVRYARKQGRPVVIFWPDGTVEG